MKFEQGTVLTDGKKYWLYGEDNKAHPIEVSTELSFWEAETSYIISNKAKPITKAMKPITDIIELTPSVKLIPKNKAVVVHSVFRQGYYDLEDSQLHYDMRKPYVISLTDTVSTMLEDYGFTGVTQYSALHNRALSDLGCWDYDYATVLLYGVVRFSESYVFYAASSMQLTDMEDYRFVLKEAVGNVGIYNKSCIWTSGSYNENCGYSQSIFHCENTTCGFLSNNLKDCEAVSSCDICFNCRWSFGLLFCLNCRCCEHCLCCCHLATASYSVFNKQVSTAEYYNWERYIRGSQEKTWADLYKALSYNKIRYLIRRKGSTITAKDVSGFRKLIKSYC